MYSKRKTIVGGLCLLFLGWVLLAQGIPDLFGIDTALAQDATRKVVTETNAIIAKVIAVLNFLTYLVLHLLEFLLNPDFILDINEEMKVGGEQILLIVWRVSRDIVNIIFAFLLIIGAVVMVVGSTRGAEIIKGYIVKFILAVILVNFSWFFPRVIIDVANVLTATIYQLPSLGPECQVRDDKGDLQPCKVITKYVMFPKGGCPPEAPDPLLPGLVCGKVEELKGNMVTSPLGVLNGLVINHARLGEIPKVRNPGPGAGAPATLREQLKELLVFFVTIVFALIAQIALFIPLLALLFVFLLRIPILWLTIAFMPFMFLGFIVGDKMGENNTMDLIWKKFLHAAFLPAVVAIPFSLGFIMLSAAAAAVPPPAHLKLKDPILLMPAVNDFWGLMWLFTSFVVIWAGVFAALKIDETYSRVGETFNSFGKNWGKFMAKGALILPGVPLPGIVKGAIARPGLLRSPEALLPTLQKKGVKGVLEMLKGKEGVAGPGIGTAVTAIRTGPSKTHLQNIFRTNINILNTSKDRGTIQDAIAKLRGAAKTANPNLTLTDTSLQELSRRLKAEIGELTEVGAKNFRSPPAAP